MEQVEYKKYPIYIVLIKWTFEEHNYEKEITEQKPNGISHTWMEKEHLCEEALNLKAWEMTNIYFERAEKESKPGVNNYSNVNVEYKFLREDSWCLKWFSHYTFDEGQDDKYFADSFREYVDRHQDINEKLEQKYKSEYEAMSKSEYVCLMGAEDSWRWGSFDDNGNQQYSYPCRCKHCKKAGIVSIHH